jgi:hypothetical protein
MNQRVSRERQRDDAAARDERGGDENSTGSRRAKALRESPAVRVVVRQSQLSPPLENPRLDGWP